jgi:hypothetical protein
MVGPYGTGAWDGGPLVPLHERLCYGACPLTCGLTLADLHHHEF